jgi:hypothetical protein
MSCARGIGAAALANFCRVVCLGARRAGLPDLMLWRHVDGMQLRTTVTSSNCRFTPGVHSARAVEVKGPRDTVRDEQR